MRPIPRRVAPGLVSLAAVIALAACGDDGDSVSSDSGGSAVPTSPASPVTVPLDAPAGPTTAPGVPETTGSSTDGAAYDHPTDADEAVIEIVYEGGFVPVGTAFVNAPVLLVAGDGTTIVSGPQIAIFPGPLLPNLQQGTLDELDVQALLARADELGLLADVEYPRNDMIADASDTVVRITVDGQTYEHRAYALGLDAAPTDGSGSPTTEGVGDDVRANLLSFVEEATAAVNDIAAEATTAYESDAFLVQARPMTAEELGSDVEPTVTPWPADASVRLADAAECAEIPWDEAADLFADATQITLFDDAGTTYQLSAVPRLPGRSCA